MRRSDFEESAFRQAFDLAFLANFADRLSASGSFGLGFRPAGTEAGHRSGALIADEMRKIGLQNVRREPFPVYAWDFGGASIQVHGPLGRTLPASSFPPAPGTRSNGLTAPLVDVGLGTAADYDGRDIRGKLAFARLDVDVMRWPGILAYEAELHGAAGIVFYYLNGYAQHPSGEALNTHDGMCPDTMPISQVSINDGRYLSDLLAEKAEIEVTLVSKVEADPQGIGYNVLGEIPGQRYADRYLFVGAHYDAWFTGYWDNVSGVAAMLAIARALIDSGYQPEHTLVFVATDAEEFGAADSIFDWLVGAQALLEAHPEWAGQTTCCFNFDTLCLKVAQSLRFYGSTEMVGFMQQVLATPDVSLQRFAQPQPTMVDYVTPWTESYSWTYFGIPVVQPSFDRGKVGETHYHTQFDQRDILDFEKTDEAVRLYGSLLVRLDQQPLPPYDFVTRAEAIRRSVHWDVAQELGIADELVTALDRFQERARRVTSALDKINGREWKALAANRSALDAAGQQLRAAARYLLEQCSYLGGDFSHEVIYGHVHWQRHLATLEGAISALEAGDASRALAILTDREGGLPGAFFGQHVSYRTYHHFTVGAVNPDRPALLWGEDRALPYRDCWVLLHDLKGKLAGGSSDFGAELYALREMRKDTLESLAEGLTTMAEVAETAAQLLPLEELHKLEEIP